MRQTLRDRRRELRKLATETEKILWPLLQVLRQQGRIFRRQHSVGPYISDFCCPTKKLIIELDGGIHDQEFQKQYDEERAKYLQARGFQVVRFTNEEVRLNPVAIVETIKLILLK